MDTLSMKELTAELNARGVTAIFAMSGGNCGTIYIGKPDAEGQYEFAVGCGNYLDDELYLGDTCWGLDDSGESDPHYYKGSSDDFTPAKVAELILTDYNKAQASACGACGEWSNKLSHNCSEGEF